MDLVKTRMFEGYAKSVPTYSLVELEGWDYDMPCDCDGPDIRDTYHAMVWRNNRLHYGVDFIGRPGLSIFATGGGQVTRVGRDYWLGIFVDLFHGDNFGYWQYSRCCHLERALVYTGQKVVKGAKIGLMGRTGDADCYHLHFARMIRGLHEITRKRLPYDQMRYVDPIPLLPKAKVLRRYNYDWQNARVPGDDQGL